MHTCMSRICLNGFGTSRAILMASAGFERPTLVISKQSLLVLYPVTMTFRTSSVLSCGCMQHMYNEPSLLQSEINKKDVEDFHVTKVVVRSLDKTLLAFALLHSLLQGQICLLLQVFLDFLLLHSCPL